MFIEHRGVMTRLDAGHHSQELYMGGVYITVAVQPIQQSNQCTYQGSNQDRHDKEYNELQIYICYPEMVLDPLTSKIILYPSVLQLIKVILHSKIKVCPFFIFFYLTIGHLFCRFSYKPQSKMNGHDKHHVISRLAVLILYIPLGLKHSWTNTVKGAGHRFILILECF